MIEVTTNSAIRDGKQSTLNSTTAAFSGGATFTGTGERVEQYTFATVSIGGSTSAATGTLYIDKSVDNSTWSSISRIIEDITAQKPFTFLITEPYIRIRYVNGSTAQTTFKLTTKYSNGNPGSISVNDADTFNKYLDAQPVRSITNHELDIARSKFNYQSVIHKFGARIGLASTYQPVCTNGIYQTPQVSGAVALRVNGGAEQNSSSGTGAREITLEGLDQTGSLATETIIPNGTSDGTASITTFLRLFRAYVSASGTYATASAGSHVSGTDIVIEDTSNNEWLRIDASSGFPLGQSQVGVYSVPLGHEAYVWDYSITVDTGKDVDCLLFQRENILQTSAPYSAMRAVVNHYGVEQYVNLTPRIPIGPFPALTDIGWMAKGASTPGVTVDFEIILIKTA